MADAASFEALRLDFLKLVQEALLCSSIASVVFGTVRLGTIRLCFGGEGFLIAVKVGEATIESSVVVNGEEDGDALIVF